MIKLKNVSKFYYSKGLIAAGFSKVSIELKLGEFVAITGESGSGKSTLLNVISGLDSYEEGEMYVNGKETSHYLEKDWEEYRRKNIGNIYQNFNLINSYTVYQNIELVLSLNGISLRERKDKVYSLLKKVDMFKYKNTKVSKLSGGQKQRVAIARALAKDVPIIIADEPTGNLDKASALNVFKILKEIAKDKLVIVVTHNYEQVEEYVTRKITMHDGKIIEDKKIREATYSENMEIHEYKQMKWFDKWRLGFRNTFNIVPKFVLLFLVYSFIVTALMGEYSFFKKGEYEESKIGSNYYYMDTNDHRIVMNKKDRSVFTKEELEALKKKKNVDYILENDANVDRTISLTNDKSDFWISGNVVSFEQLKAKVDVGRLPKEDNEMVIEGNKDDYYLSFDKETLLKQKVFRESTRGEVQKTKEYYIVGIIYSDSSASFGQYRFYVSDSFLKDMIYETNEEYSTITIDFMGTNHISYPYATDFRLEKNNWVTPGTAIISEDYNGYCDKGNCKNKSFSVQVKNMYYEENKTFVIEKFYNKKNITYTLDLPNYDKNFYEDLYNGVIYINPLDYDPLFNKGTYQVSLYVKNIEQIEQTAKDLEEAGYHTLMIKDTLYKTGVAEVLRIIKIIITIILVAVLFFISYFIIRIILKSRNIYFSIIRMLGASKRIGRQLLVIELFIISNLCYFIFLAVAECNRHGIINVDFIHTVNTYFRMNDYIILYVIITGMSILISIRYARKLFKTSAMNTYREEV